MSSAKDKRLSTERKLEEFEKIEAKVRYFEGELVMYGLTADQREYIRKMMLNGVEIMTKKEITKCIEDHIEVRGW